MIKNVRRASLIATAIVLLPAVAAASNRLGVVRGLEQFDLICRTQSKTVTEAHARFVANSDLKVGPLTTRTVVDLRTRRYCEVNDCERLGAEHIASVNPRRIVFESGPVLRWTVDRSTGVLSGRMEGDGRVHVTTGRCRMARFSGLPNHNRQLHANEQ